MESENLYIQIIGLLFCFVNMNFYFIPLKNYA